jgi:putative aldouronate transport system permease protein
MSGFMRIVYIDFPAILPTATILRILNFGRIMTIGFEKTYLMQNNLNLARAEVISTYVYKVGMTIGGGDFSYATAIGLFNSVVNLILIVTVNKICSRMGGSSLW